MRECVCALCVFVVNNNNIDVRVFENDIVNEANIRDRNIQV